MSRKYIDHRILWNLRWPCTSAHLCSWFFPGLCLCLLPGEKSKKCFCRSGSPAEEDGTRLSVNIKDAEQFAAMFREIADRLHIAVVEMKEPNLSKRVSIVEEAISKGKLPLNSWSLDYYRQFNSKDKRQGPGKRKEGLFPDHIPYFLDSDGIRMVELFEDHMELRAYRQFREKAGRSPDSCSRFVKKFGNERLFCLKFNQRVRPEDVQRLLLPGVWVGGQLYNFLGCSQAGLKERTALLWRGSNEEVAGRLAECGDFHKISTVSKRMAREGLLFSSVQMSGVHVEKEDIIKGEDIEDGAFCFTDGCGEISDAMLARVMKTLPNSLPGYLPSVVQLRLQGIKGVVARNPRLEAGKLMIRPSQTKFQTNFDNCLAVAGTSRPYTFAHLNKQFVLLLSGLGVKDSVFISLHEEFFGMVETMLQDKEAAVTILQWKNEWETAQHLAKMSSLKFSSFLSQLKPPSEMYRDTNYGVEVMKKLSEVQEKILTSNKKEKDGIEKDKLRVLVRQSRLLYGVCDQNGGLEYGQCQVLTDSKQSNPHLSLSGEDHNRGRSRQKSEGQSCCSKESILPPGRHQSA